MIYLIPLGILILLVVFFTIRNRRQAQHDQFIKGVERGLEDYRAGKMQDWEKVKRDLGY